MTMTDTPLQGVTLDVNFLRQTGEKIANLDNEIAAGSEGAGKRKIINQYVEQYTTRVFDPATELDPNVPLTQVKENFDLYWESESDIGWRIALFFSFQKELKAYEDQLDAEIQRMVDSQPKGEKKSNDELQKLADSRKQCLQIFRQTKQILELYGFDVSGIVEPKAIRGSRGVRGKRSLSDFQFSLDGVKLSADENSLPKIATTLGNVNFKSVDLRKLLVEKVVTGEVDKEGKPVPFDPKNPPDEWSVQLPNGVMLSGKKMDEPAVVDDDPDDDDGVTTDAE